MCHGDAEVSQHTGTAGGCLTANDDIVNNYDFFAAPNDTVDIVRLGSYNHRGKTK